MRKTLFFLSVLAILPVKSQEIYRGIEASKVIQDAAVVRTSQHSNLPSYVQFYPGKEIDLDDLNIWLKKNLQLGPKMDWKLLRVEEDKQGDKHYRYRQTIDGTPIEAGTLIAHTKNDKVYSINGNYYQILPNVPSVSISEEVALNNAKAYVGATLYKWEMPGEEAHYKMEQDDESATYYPTAEIVMVSDDFSFRPQSYRKAYKFNLYAHEPMGRSYVYVDVVSGEIIQEQQILHDADVVGTAETVYSGSQSINTDSFAGGYRLRDASRGGGVNTYDMNTGTSYGASVDFVDDDNNWNNVNPQKDEYATDAHFGAEKTYDYYWFVHGRNSIDDAGFALNSYVHYSTGYVNAFWDGTRMTYGDGNATYSPLTSMDIAGHEVSHGLTTFTADLIYNAESGALNESFSDIFGTAIENYATPADWDWLIGEDIGSAFRNMSNPNAFNDPDTYFGTYWASLTGPDSGGVHTNSGVQNFWYYLLHSGGTGTNDNGDAYDVIGQGWDVASSIAFRNLTVYLTESSQYIDARFYAIQSAVDLYGSCSPEVEATADAWYAVGVGPEYFNEVIADFTSNDTLFCSYPANATFDNLSVNGDSYGWDFGDGGTSIVTSPTHTYTAPGTYTVTLIADGGACGIDTLTLVDYIVIDTTMPCIVTMPDDGIGNTQTSCSGTIYDSGGPTANYGANQDAQITIAPTGAATVDLSVISFAIEAGPSGTCNYDYLEIYDGPDAAAPLIDRYCNNNVPPATISSTGPEITLVFHSDPGLQLAGFEINWDCVLPDVPPVADFEADVDTSCTGIINFLDLSTNGPTNWDWDFGDGDTSTDQNPTHEYTTSGLYTVVLTATNGIGSDAETKVDYIFIDIPTEPVAAGDSICEGNSTDLTAAGMGTINWYDAAVGGTLLYTGATYTTPVLSSTTTYWVEDEIESSPVNEGPADNTFGGGSYFNGDQHLIFNVDVPCILNSVKVYANGTDWRTIELRNNMGSVLESIIVNIPDGEQVVDLGWDLPVGTGYQLGVELGSNPDLYRNNSGPSYPYNISGLAEITSSSAGGSYYYFFYDWELQEPSCISDRAEVEVAVLVNDSTYVDALADDLCENASPVGMTTSSSGGTWVADCGGCIDSGTGEFDPLTAGDGTWSISYETGGLCTTPVATDVVVLPADTSYVDAVSDICENGSAVTMTTSSSGGTWSSDCGGCIDGATGSFDPLAAGAGTWSVSYETGELCATAIPTDITVLPADTTHVEPLSDPLCEDAAPVTLTTASSGGTWVADCGACIDGTTGEFDPSVAGVGTWSVSYETGEPCEIALHTDVVVVSCLGLDEGSNSLFTIYPNPTNGVIHISTGGSTAGSIEVLDVLGRKVFIYNYTSDNFDVDLSDLQARSTYFVRLITDNGQLISVKKLIKK